MVGRPARAGGRVRRGGLRLGATAGCSWTGSVGSTGVGGLGGKVDADAGAGAAGLGVGEADRPAVQVGDPAGDGEAEAGAAAARRCPLSVPNRSNTRSRSRPRRRAPRRRPRAASGRRSASRSPGRRSAGGLCRDGVVEQVGDQLAQPGGVGVRDEVRAASTRTSYVTSRPPTRASATAASSSAPTATVSRCQRRLAGVDPGEVEQVGDQGRHPLGLVERGAQRGAGRARRRRRRGSPARRTARPAACGARG